MVAKPNLASAGIFFNFTTINVSAFVTIKKKFVQISGKHG